MPRANLFKTILCPVDFSEPSALALQYADAMARRTRSRLAVTYINDPLLVAASAAALQDRDLVSRSRRELNSFVKTRLQSGSTRPGPFESVVSVGAAGREILKAASRTRADLIVMGTHGLTGAARILIGSTTLTVLRNAAVAVLAVPWQKELAGPPARDWPGSRIVAPVDLARTAIGDVERAATIAEAFGATLLLLHVVERTTTPAWFTDDLSVHDRIQITNAQRHIERLAAVARRHVQTDTKIASGWPADEIAETALDEGAQLVITTLRDRGNWFRSTRGSVSYHILSHAVSPVLALPPRWRPRQ